MGLGWNNWIVDCVTALETRLRQEVQHQTTEVAHLKQGVDERMEHLEERVRTKGRVECDNIYKAHETLHHTVATEKHRVDAALSREADFLGQFE